MKNADFRDFNGDKSILFQCEFMNQEDRKNLKKLIARSNRIKHNKKKGYITINFKGKIIKRSRAVIQVEFNCILPKNIHIHHINENEQDDRLKNLAILRDYDHLSLHCAGKRRIKNE